jgi:hypothetical protein
MIIFEQNFHANAGSNGNRGVPFPNIPMCSTRVCVWTSSVMLALALALPLALALLIPVN